MKRKLPLFLAVCFALQLLIPLGALGASGFSIASLVTVARYMTGQITLTPQQITQYDLDGNGEVSISDLTAIARILTGGPIPDAPSGDLDDEQIIERALAEVPGADRSSITRLEREMEDGQLICEVEIIHDGFEYEFEIAASDGTFQSWSCEKIVRPVPAAGDIGMDEAAVLALARIPGASSEDIVSLKAETENNAKVYEGLIHCDGRIYDFEIAAADGTFLRWSWKLTAFEPAAPTSRPTDSPSSQPTSTAAPSPAVSAPPSGRPTQNATPTAKPQLTREEAQEIVLSYIPGADVSDFTEFRSDIKNGIPVYKGELRYRQTEYEFVIAASDGMRYAWSWERRPQAGAPGTDIGMAQARALALAEVPGAAEADFIKAERDSEDGVSVYEIKIFYAETEYEFKIVASTGVFCSYSFERRIYLPGPMPTYSPHPTASSTRPGPSPTPAAAISAERAKEIALAEVPGATLMNIIKCRLDAKDNVYEVEIRYDGREYEFEIDASAGTILSKETDQVASAPTGEPIRPEAARQLVLDRVPGASRADFQEFGLGYHHGRLVYEGELRYNRTDYEFRIDAYSGAFLLWEED